MNLRIWRKMTMNKNEFDGVIGEVNAEKVKEIMKQADAADKTLVAMTLSAFVKKKESNEKLIRSIESLVMLETILDINNIKDLNLPSPQVILDQAYRLGDAIENVIDAIQTYAKEYEEFNNVTDTKISELEEYRQNLNSEE